MDDTKSILTSKTVAGLAVVVIGLVAPIVQQKFGVTVTGDDANAALAGVSKVVEALGVLLALYGRIKATKKIG